MHDDRRITEVRLDRFVRERIAPAVYPRSVPLTLSSWDVPDEPVPALEALRQEFTAAGARGGLGQAVEHQVAAPAGRRSPTPGARRRTRPWKSSWTWASAATFPGFQCEGIAWRPDGTIIKAISPRNQYIPLKLLGSGMAVDFYVEAAANPDLSQGWTFAATPYGDKATSGTSPAVPAGHGSPSPNSTRPSGSCSRTSGPSAA